MDKAVLNKAQKKNDELIRNLVSLSIINNLFPMKHWQLNCYIKFTILSKKDKK